MSTITFDTHELVKNLKEAGFDERQTENSFSAKLEKEIVKAKNSILLWVSGMMLAQSSLIFGFFGKALDLF